MADNPSGRAPPRTSGQASGRGLLYYGDNPSGRAPSGRGLDVLRRHIRDESVDLIYLDPPFNSSSDVQNGMGSERNSQRDQEANRL